MAQPSSTVKKETDQVETDKKENFEDEEGAEDLEIIMDFIKPVNCLVLNGNVSENWRKFIQNFEIFLEAADLLKKSDSRKVAVFLNAIGEEGLELFQTFNLDEDERKCYKDVVAAFENFCVPKKRIVYERFLFFSRIQKDGEPFDNFLVDIKKLSKACDFGEQQTSLMRDRIVLGINNKRLQEKLLEKDVDFERAVEMCRAAEISEGQTKVIQMNSGGAVAAAGNAVVGSMVHQINTNKKESNYKNKFNRNDKITAYRQNDSLQCKKCNRHHKPMQCPAFGKKCIKCNQLNHFAVCCNQKNVSCIETVDSDTDNDIFYINMISDRKENKWVHSLKIEESFVEVKLDTGSDANVLSYKVFKEIKSQSKIYPTSTVLEAYGGQKITPIGESFLKCYYNNKMSIEKFIIIKENYRSILGEETMEKLEIVKKINNIEIKREYTTTKEDFIAKNLDVFNGVGSFPGKYKIKLTENAIPVVKPPRRVPLKILKPLQNSLEALIEKNIISKVNEPRDWVHNLVIIEKSDGTLRLCLDPRNLNKYVKKEQHLIPTLNEILPKLNNAKYFSVLDLKEGFYQVELDEESRKLCTFATPFGSFNFNRLPFGLSTAPEIFQRKNEENFSNIPNIAIYIDDLLIYGKTIEEHDEALRNVINRARELNIKFNPKKLQYKVKEIDYLGHKFTTNGILPSKERINAIQNLRDPNNKKELQKFLGLVNYVRSFIPNLAEITSPLRELLKKNTLFVWQKAHSDTVAKIKEMLVSSVVLKPFDENKQIFIQTDASQNGLGCCLLQNNAPIAYASRSLSETEQRYAQIEKELLAIIFSCRKFHHYIYGREVIIKTDHKPLIGLMEKEIYKIPSGKLQRMCLRLLNYNVKLEYLPGKYMYIADYLSRNPLNLKPAEEEPVFYESILSINVSEKRENQLKEETKKDEQLSKILLFYKNGWPKDKSKVPENLRFYFGKRNDIVENDGILYYNDKIMIPDSLKTDMLNLLHESHMGIFKTQKRARSIMYWKNMNSDIEDKIFNCKICDQFSKNNMKEPLIPHDIPSIPFHKVGCDIATYGGKDYLIVVDYLTKWIEYKLLRNKTSSEIIKHWVDIFSQFGIPKIIIADNVPFGSFECKSFATKWNIEIITSSPLYPKSNGLAERSVQIIKNIFKKSTTHEEICVQLMEYRNTPTQDMSLTPSQLMFNRLLRTKLPVSDKLLSPNYNNTIKEQVIKKGENSEKYYNKSTRREQTFKEGDKVLIKDRNKWKNGTILYKWNTPRSYIVEDEEGKEYRRNSWFLKNKSLKNRSVSNSTL